MARRLLLMFVVVLVSCSPPTNKMQKAKHEAFASGKIFMVEFGADWCSDCRVLSKELQSHTVVPNFEARFFRYKVDVGQFDRNLDTAKSLGVSLSQIPTAVFFTPEGKRIERSGLPQILSFIQALGREL